MSSQKYSRHVSFTYMLIIAVGMIVLFIQFYSLATSMYRDRQFNEQINKFRVANEKKKEEITNKQLEYISTQLESTQIRFSKESEDNLYRDEQMKIINNSEELAHNNLEDVSTLPAFSQPRQEITLIKDEDQKIHEIKTRPKIEQWVYFIFHIE